MVKEKQWKGKMCQGVDIGTGVYINNTNSYFF